MRITIRLNDTEYNDLLLKVNISKFNISEFVRKALANSKVKSKLTEDEVKLCRNLIGIANNINQLSRRANEREDLLFLSIELLKTLRAVNDTLNSLKINK